MPDEAALESAHLSRYDALLRTSKTLATHRTIGELFRVLGDELHPIIPFDYLALLLHEDQRGELRLVILEPADLALPFESKPIAEHGPAAMVWETQQAAVVPIPGTGPLHPAVAVLRDHGWKMTCCLPLTTAQGRIGVLVFGSRSPSAYSTDVVAFMEQIAANVAIAVENGINREQSKRFETELQEERDRLQFLLDVNNLLLTQPDYHTLLQAICDTVQRIAEADHVGVALYDSDADQLRLDSIYDKARGFSTSGAMIPLNGSAAGVAFQTGSAGVFRRAELERNGWIGASLLKAESIESMCCVPLVTRNGKLGTLYVGSPRPDAFSEGDVSLLGHISPQIAIALEQARARERLASLNAHLTDEKQYLELELGQEFGEIVGPARRCARC